jgi:GNAT superfamily N-acetyltransferase
MELTLSCSKGSTEVRAAEVEDLPAIMDMGRQFFDQAWKGIFDWDETSVFDTLAGLMSRGILLVAVEDATKKGWGLYPRFVVVGMIGGTLAPMYFDKSTLIAQELFWWVQPGCRGSGLKLFKAFEQEARKRGADVVAMNGVESIRGETVGRFYEREGFVCTERTYLKRV